MKTSETHYLPSNMPVLSLLLKYLFIWVLVAACEMHAIPDQVLNPGPLQ